ncbi:C40 family peptidase [Mycobacterium sp. M1]|uniref:C40 family peptidase n=1 Tax=Mycolicibacter acidiphilus TaxID=2835306 RepID=A0ABS5RND5_9MYCO|nr:NlpC/P60 family protein [Mycolicibacter acidiphilus]MBS9535694.1 C40 family peptidase [Mycolicibacter acidiphilus]
MPSNLKELLEWVPEIDDLATATRAAAKNHANSADFYNALTNTSTWEGSAGDAARASSAMTAGQHDEAAQNLTLGALGMARAQHQADILANKIRGLVGYADEEPAVEVDLETNKVSLPASYDYLDEDAQAKIDRKMTVLEGQIPKLLAEGQRVDTELSHAIAAATGLPEPEANHGHEVPGQPAQPEGGKMTPADQLPLPPKSGNPTPTEATRDNSSPDPGVHLTDNPNPSPLLAGLSAEQWRERLAHFKPGDPLPDPRTPTGDKAIDALAHAASQQNTSYAWGANGSKDGPSSGHKATHPEYPNKTQEQLEQDGSWLSRDDERVGYDCGGLVRYSVQQGAGIDVGMGTNRIDTNPQLTQGPGHIPSATLNNSAAGPGDILVFGGSRPFEGGNTDHTGLYIGNGYYINAPQSGDPVRVDNLRLRLNDYADVLKVPGQ